MAVAGIQLTAQIAELKELQQAIGRIFTPADKAKILEAALEKAVFPAFLRLKETTPVGPTGNLKRAATYKVKAYTKDGNAVALLGYTRADREKSQSAQGGSVRAGKDLGYHQWWLERGTKQRVISKLADKSYTRKAHTRTMRSGVVANVQTHEVSRQGGYIASSFARLGPFRFEKTGRTGEGHRVQTQPSYPNAFFRKSKTPIVIPPMPVGGLTGRPPLKTAWDQTRGQVAEILQRELRISLEKALETLTYSATGTAS